MNKVWLLFFSLLVFSPELRSQAHNSAEHHRQWNPQHAGYDGRQNHAGAVISIPNEVWNNKYGAIAYDPVTNSVWFAEDQPSQRAARREALRRCGRRSCELAIAATNACLAAGDASGNRVYFGYGLSGEDAVSEVNERCARDGQICNIGYVHCNTPVRIR